MHEKIKVIQQNAIESIRSCTILEDIERERIRFLGKKGEVTSLFRFLKDIPLAEKPTVGGLINQLKEKISAELQSKKNEIETLQLKEQLLEESIDVSLPGIRTAFGRIHPLNQTLHHLIDIFHSLGFSIVHGPEIETEHYNFDSLNIPSYHPARDMQDTFFLKNGMLLRTHTSPVQIRVMENKTPPVRVIAPGRVYRNEAINYKSYCLFHQVEGFYVNTHVSFSELKGVLAFVIRELFGSQTEFRIRPSYFPFTEPSLECDIRMNGKSDWMEILGAGMIHPEVLKSVGYNPREVQGYAFGMGIERITMLRYGIDDIRLLYDNDIRFLSQF